MFVSLKTADRLDSSFQDIGMNTKPCQHPDDDLQVVQSQVWVQGRIYQITVLIRPVVSHPIELLPTRSGRQIPVMTGPLP